MCVLLSVKQILQASPRVSRLAPAQRVVRKSSFNLVARSLGHVQATLRQQHTAAEK